jgi:hypothetical protein
MHGKLRTRPKRGLSQMRFFSGLLGENSQFVLTEES